MEIAGMNLASPFGTGLPTQSFSQHSSSGSATQGSNANAATTHGGGVSNDSAAASTLRPRVRRKSSLGYNDELLDMYNFFGTDRPRRPSFRGIISLSKGIDIIAPASFQPQLGALSEESFPTSNSGGSALYASLTTGSSNSTSSSAADPVTGGPLDCCGVSFSCLSDLVDHYEHSHINFQAFPTATNSMMNAFTTASATSASAPIIPGPKYPLAAAAAESAVATAAAAAAATSNSTLEQTTTPSNGSIPTMPSPRQTPKLSRAEADAIRRASDDADSTTDENSIPTKRQKSVDNMNSNYKFSTRKSSDNSGTDIASRMAAIQRTDSPFLLPGQDTFSAFGHQFNTPPIQQQQLNFEQTSIPLTPPMDFSSITANGAGQQQQQQQNEILGVSTSPSLAATPTMMTPQLGNLRLSDSNVGPNVPQFQSPTLAMLQMIPQRSTSTPISHGSSSPLNLNHLPSSVTTQMPYSSPLLASLPMTPVGSNTPTMGNMQISTPTFMYANGGMDHTVDGTPLINSLSMLSPAMGSLNGTPTTSGLSDMSMISNAVNEAVSMSSPAASMPVSTPSRSNISLSSTGKKVYRCPKPFCSKIYKNSNGLRYHLEHGNCELYYSGGEADPDTNEITPDLLGARQIAQTAQLQKQQIRQEKHLQKQKRQLQEAGLQMPAEEGELTTNSSRASSLVMTAAVGGNGMDRLGEIKIALRPYWCRVGGCGKKYKNLNGLKYHAKIVHPHLDFKNTVKGHTSLC